MMQQKIYIILFILFCSTTLSAQPGSLDVSYSSDGKVTTDINSDFENDDANSIVLQPDGKIVAVGSFETNTNYSDFAVVRYNTNGSIDNSFGQVVTEVSGNYQEDAAYAAAIQTDGKIIAAGITCHTWLYDVYHEFALVRYNTNGTLDSNFGDNGIVKTSFGLLADAYANSVVIQSDGKIILGGYKKYNYLNHDFILVRYNTDGSVDSSFGDEGIVITSFGDYTDSYGRSLALQANGKIVMVGSSYDSNNSPNYAIARYNTDGSLDSSFSADGLLTFDFDGESDEAHAIAIQTDGKMVVAGYSRLDSAQLTQNNFSIARIDTDGTLDVSFSGDGKNVTDFNSQNDHAACIAIQNDNKIVVGGYSRYGDQDFELARYNSNGTIDLSFGSLGKVTTSFFPNYSGDEAYSVVIQSDGKIVLAGFTVATDYNYDLHDFALARYIADFAIGVLDFTASSNLMTIYPNPIGKNAMLEYCLQNDDIISIHLLDIHGKMISTFIEEEKEQIGVHRHEITFPDFLPSGSYMIVISNEAGEKVSIKVEK
ncbi:MAG TPA: T9SS type A sorting domain-containing protein [Chitinophagales bacterium]|nr:T9SS type A sorting domain-containing protein [Chitinophagales bacterium]